MQKTEDKTRNPSRAEISVTQRTRYRHRNSADPQFLSHRDRQEGAHIFIAAEGAHFTPADDALVAPARVEP